MTPQSAAVENQTNSVATLQAANDELTRRLVEAEETIRTLRRHAADEAEARRRAEARLESELADSMLLQSVSAEIVQSENSQALYDKLLDAAVVVMRSEFASMQMLYPERGERGELRLLASHGYDLHAAKFWEWVRTDSSCTCGIAMQTRQRAVASDVRASEIMAGTPDQANALRMGMFAMQSTPLISRTGKLVGMISTHWKQTHTPAERDLRLLDILARQAADLLERRQAEEALRDADRRKTEFLAMLAHELRNPLAPIRHAVEVLRLTAGGDEAMSSTSAMMERQIAQMVRLVDDLLDVSRISRGTIELKPERVELASVVYQAVEAAGQACELAGIELTVTLPPKPIYLNADPARLAQVIGNLLNNAVKFTDRGGRIGLTVEQEGEQALVRIRDTGIGIAPDQLPRIFDMFMQIDTSLERSRSGLGIGLTLVKNLVELHGGAVQVKSNGLGQGSEFAVCLPVLLETPKPSPSIVDGAMPTPGRRILVVDDNRDSASSLAMLLKLTGNVTEIAFDGLEAVEAVERFQPAIALLDIGLPKLNGYEACRRIRETATGKEIVLIALTGWGQEEDRQRTRDAGFDGHLVKPVEYATLAKLLADASSRAAARS
jgi:signal transduction histidine kinase/ActR/RegA family two-component response regulator